MTMKKTLKILLLPYFGQYLQHLNSRVNHGQKP